MKRFDPTDPFGDLDIDRFGDLDPDPYDELNIDPRGELDPRDELSPERRAKPLCDVFQKLVNLLRNSDVDK